jgi:macrolide-specific efflux system membrane fusion protein
MPAPLPVIFSVLSILVAVASSQAQSPSTKEQRTQSTAEQHPDPIRLRFDQARTSLIQNTVVASPISGVVDRVVVRLGQTIDAGTVVIEIDSQLAEQALRAARTASRTATLKSENDINLRHALRSLEIRKQKLRQGVVANDIYSGSVSEMELEELQLEVEQAALVVERAEHDVRIAAAAAAEKQTAVAIAETKLNHHRVESKVGGRVTEIAVESGEWVTAGQPAVRVILLDPLRIECSIDGRRYGRELVGRRAEFSLLKNGEPVKLVGKVEFVSPELDPDTGKVRLWATVDNPDGRVGAGASGTLRIGPAD